MQGGTNVYTYAIRRQGASHIRENIPCQDSFALWTGIVEEKQIHIMAVADGHGGKKYDLSQYGAALAAEAAIEELILFYREYSRSKNELFKHLQSFFPTNVLKRWREKINNDIEKRDKLASNPLGISKRYGTTLLVSLITPEGIFLGQLGDGDILIVQRDGQVERPIPESKELIANETYSLSSNESIKLWKIETYSIDSLALILISSDGLSNCFENDDEFYKFVNSFYSIIVREGIKNSVEKTLEQLQLEKYFDNASRAGSGDDITFAFALVKPEFIKVN